MPSVTLAQMEQRVWNRVENNTIFYTQTEVDNAINMALRTLNAIAGFYQQTIPVPLTVKNRFFYDLPAPCMIPLNINFEGRALQKEWLSRLASNRRNVITAVGKPQFWVPIGLRKILLSPADSVGGRFMEVQAICEPPQLISPNDTMVLSDEWTELIEEDAFRYLVLKEGGAAFTAAARLFMKWGPRLEALSQWANYTAPRFFVEKDSSK